MRSEAKTPEAYLAEIPEDRRTAMSQLRDTILSHLPKGFEEVMNYGMIGYVVPHSTYPDGYHCDPKQPLPFLNIASQKHYIAVYHAGIYADKDTLDWFLGEYPKYLSTKPDMGKSCIRFKKVNTIPYELIGQLCEKISVAEWIDIYEKQVKKR